MYQEGQRIELEDGTVGTIIEVLGDRAEYDVEIATPDGPHAYEWKTVHPKDIKGLHRPKSQRSETQDRGHPRGWPSSCRERGGTDTLLQGRRDPCGRRRWRRRHGLRGDGIIPPRAGSAPKQHLRAQSIRRCAITSQNGTAPKRVLGVVAVEQRYRLSDLPPSLERVGEGPGRDHVPVAVRLAVERRRVAPDGAAAVGDVRRGRGVLEVGHLASYFPGNRVYLLWSRSHPPGH